MDVKIKAIAIVVMLVAVAIVGIAIYRNDDDKSATGYNIDASLQVYGNADGDYKIDSNDIAVINDIISGKRH
jgi:hypothetical protein